MTIRLSEVLAPIDRRALRRIAAASGKLYASQDVDTVRDEWAAALLDAMMSAHMAALKEYVPFVAAFGETKVEKQALRKLYGAMARSLSDQSMSKVRDSLLGSIEDGIEAGTSAYKKSVTKALKRAGIRPGAGPLAQTAVLTQTAIAFNASAWNASQEDDSLWGYEYSTAGDERVRESHAALDGVRYPRDHKFWNVAAPPNGWRCRCGINPIYRGDKRARVRPFRGTLDVDPAFRVNFGRLFE